MGRLFKVPTIGPARQMLDRHLKAIDAYMKYQAALTDFYGKMIQPGMEALSELATKTQEIAQGPLTPETFERFYQLLLKSVEQRFAELFKSPPFLAALEHTLHTSLEFYAQMNSVVEEQLKGTPIVTRRELDEVLKEVYELRKEVRALKKE
jgi:class III poly(R)-hydroxyalkanoic acid synthase PhaE subunit